MILFEIVIMIVGVGPELQLFHLDHVLLLPGLVLLLFLLVLVVTEVHGFGHGWHRGGRDYDQIEAHLLRFTQRCGGRHHLCRAIREHCAHFTGADGLIHVLSAVLSARGEISAWNHVSYLCGCFRICDERTARFTTASLAGRPCGMR